MNFQSPSSGDNNFNLQLVPPLRYCVRPDNTEQQLAAASTRKIFAYPLSNLAFKKNMEHQRGREDSRT